MQCNVQTDHGTRATAGQIHRMQRQSPALRSRVQGFRGNHLHDYLQRAMRHNPFTETQENVDRIYRYPLRPLSPSSTLLQTAICTKTDRSPGNPPSSSILHGTRHPNPENCSQAGCPLPAHRHALHGTGEGRGAAPGMLALGLTGAKVAG